MTIGHDLEQRLDGWMQEDTTLPDDLREVLAKLPETSQRRHRWSFTLADLTWRTRTMFSATRVAAVIAILALGTSVTLIAGPLGPSTEVIPAQQALERQPPVIVSGESSSIISVDMGDAEYEDEIMTVHGNVSDVIAEMDDPRVSGTYRLTQSAVNYGGMGSMAQDDEEMGPMWGTMRVENDDGAWVGPVSGYFTSDETYFSGCLAGETAYEGHTFCLRVGADTLHRDVTLDGMIYKGNPPPAQ